MANDPPFAPLNHAASDSGIPGESGNRRIGINAFFVAKFSGWQREFAKRYLRKQSRVEWIADIKRGADSLPCVWGVWQLILLMCHVKTCSLRIRPKAVSLSSRRKEVS